MKSDQPPFRIAAICTAYFPISHADVILSRWWEHRPGDAQWGWHGPRSRIASLYVDRFEPNDIGRQVAADQRLPLCTTVADALTLGGGSLAIDGVMIIGEHGSYGKNALGQKLYPRRELFDQVVAVFDRCGQSVPVFSDKHLSYDFDSALHMVNTARQRGFTFFAGSSLPHCPTTPALPPANSRAIEQAMTIFFGDTEAYGYHAIEYALSHMEKRSGGESGIRQVTAFTDGDAIEAARRDGLWSQDMLDAAMTLAHPPKPDRVHDKEAMLWVFEHNDGLRVAYFCLDRKVNNWIYAHHIAGETGPAVGTSVLAGLELYYPHFATFSRVIEDGLMTGRPSFPMERVLLSTGATEALMRSLAQPGTPLPTPHLNIRYQPQAASPQLPSRHLEDGRLGT